MDLGSEGVRVCGVAMPGREGKGGDEEKNWSMGGFQTLLCAGRTF